MKHGLMMLALLCWFASAAFAAPGGPGGPQALSLQEMEAVEGGDLFLAVDRNRQMMTVTQVTPGYYYGSQSYSVKVTTSVVRNQDLSAQNVKGDMTNAKREIAMNTTNLKGEQLYQLPVQYPSGTYSLDSRPTTLPSITGPAIRTSAYQVVPVVTFGGSLYGSTKDSGYYIHYANPAAATNTLGCIGVQSLEGMNKVAATLKADTATYSSPAAVKQTVTVSAYTTTTPPPAVAFTPSGYTPPVPPAATPVEAPKSTASTSASSSTSSSSSTSTSTPAPKPPTTPKAAPVTKTFKMNML